MVGLVCGCSHGACLQRVAGDTHLLSDAPANGTTVEYITDFINGEGTPEDLLFRLINDSVTDHNAGTVWFP